VCNVVHRADSAWANKIAGIQMNIGTDIRGQFSNAIL
jgi:hypothetical protein